MAYIEDTGNLDARTEGMSYGMMFCVQMDRKEDFDRLWKWAKTYMWMSEGENEGYFAWSCGNARHKQNLMIVMIPHGAARPAVFSFMQTGSQDFPGLPLIIKDPAAVSPAEASREYLALACHPVTGMSAEYAEFDGQPPYAFFFPSGAQDHAKYPSFSPSDIHIFTPLL